MARKGILQTIVNCSATLALFSLFWTYLYFSQRCYVLVFQNLW